MLTAFLDAKMIDNINLIMTIGLNILLGLILLCFGFIQNLERLSD